MTSTAAPPAPPETVEEFYATVETAVTDLIPRLQIFLEEYGRHRQAVERPLEVLDIGCGRQAVLSGHIDPSDLYTGADIVEPDQMGIERFVSINLIEERLAPRLDDRRFDVVFCGEVIEHLFSPDVLLQDIRALLEPGGVLILSTPNLAYWVNRILLPLGISPLFLENSSWHKLGRRTRFLGQGNKTEGHIRVFTHRAVLDLLELHGFELLRVRSTSVWNLPLDQLVCRFSPSLAAQNTYVVRAA